MSTALLEQTSGKLLPELKLYVQRHRTAVERMIRSGGPQAGLPAATQTAKNFDGLLSSLFHAVRGVFEARRTWMPVCLAAVGSYGRGTLAYRSDLDVRLLCRGSFSKAAPIAEALLYPLWDVGLSIGHQVVGTGHLLDLSRNDLATATSVLDWRLIAGDSRDSDKMLDKAFKALFSERKIVKFLEQLSVQSLVRGERYGDSVYLLEPDVKNGLGGLRDLDVAHWAARARWQIGHLSELAGTGALTHNEWEQINAAAALLWRVRNLLHLYSGRCVDRLSFDRQEQLASDLGYGSGGAGVEHFMSDYYRNARVLVKARETILSRAEPPPKRRPTERLINAEFKLVNDRLAFRDAMCLERDPALALGIYWTAVEHDFAVDRSVRDAISRQTGSPAFCAALRKSRDAAQYFCRLCCVVKETKLRDGSPLRELHDVGLLVAMVPEFAPVVGRVHHDVYHVYTVDVHSVTCVDRARALCRGELAEEHPLASRLAAELARPQVLFFAALLHDVGKDIGGRNHSQRGYSLATSILGRLGVSQADIEEVRHLVLKHLRMYHVATRRDIDDPKTVQGFCAEVHGSEGLKELYLLTLADVSTTSPTALTSWKARMLEDLYLQALSGLDRSGRGPDENRAAAVRTAVVDACSPDEDREFLDFFLTAMPDRYLHANEPSDIVQHARFARAADGSSVLLKRFGFDGVYVEVGLVADDRPGLLAMITACFVAVGAKVLGAQIYSYKDRSGRARALDLFWVRIGARARAVDEALPRVERNFMRLVSGEIAPAELVAGKSTMTRWSVRPTPKVPTRVSLDNRASLGHTVVEVITQDRPGLLFWLSHSLQELGLTISLAKINTEGMQVADVFYVTDKNGAKLSEPSRIEALKTRIVSVVEQLDATTTPRESTKGG